MRLVSASACWTRVVTAFSTSVAARSVRGLKLCFRSDANSSGSRVSTDVGFGLTLTGFLSPWSTLLWITVVCLLGFLARRRPLVQRAP